MKILIIGLGSIARKHIAALDKIGESFSYFALRSSDNSPAVDGVQNIYAWSYVPEDINFAIIANPTDQHTQAIEECINRNIPLFIEKPLAHKLDGLSRLAEKINEKGIRSYVACNLRFLPVLLFLKNNLGNRRINEVNIYCGSSLPAWRPGTDYTTSYSADEARGGGVHLDL
ncbi:MAG: Gfo/Idh/MocA family oxidoreductase, partial [Sediminibacterium sp.]